jgi:hypothetical protein
MEIINLLIVSPFMTPEPHLIAPIHKFSTIFVLPEILRKEISLRIVLGSFQRNLNFPDVWSFDGLFVEAIFTIASMAWPSIGEMLCECIGVLEHEPC